MHAARNAALALLLVVFWLGLPAAHAKDGEDPEPTKRPMLWVATGPSATFFLYGTLHVPDRRIVALPAVVSQALAVANAFLPEVPLGDDAAQQILPFVRLPRNRSLEEIVPAALRERLDALLATRGESLSTWSRVKPWVLDAYMGIMDAPKETATEIGLDQTLYRLATQMGKPVDALESVYEQIRIYDLLEYDQQVELLKETADRLERDRANGTNSIGRMVEIYRAGDENELLREVDSYYDLSRAWDRRLRDRMVTKRNARMVERLLERAEKQPDRLWMVAVGAAHLPGADGILATLAEKGFDVWRVVDERQLPESRAEAAYASTRRELDRSMPEIARELLPAKKRPQTERRRCPRQRRPRCRCPSCPQRGSR